MTLLPVALLAGAALAAFAAHEAAATFAASRVGGRAASRARWAGRGIRTRLDPFGSVILPLVGIGLAATGARFPIFAYARRSSADLGTRGDREPVSLALAGPLAQFGLALVGGLALRSAPGGGVGLAADAAFALLSVSVTMALWNLLPVPGLDGSRLLVRVLPPRAAEVYRGLDAYLPLSLLVILFVLPGPILPIVGGLASFACRAFSGGVSC